jgi:penicillin amidase
MNKQRLSFYLLTLALLGTLLPIHQGCARSSAVAIQPEPTNIQVAGLRASVSVRRDERGVPYIEAANQEDLYFAQGYVVAKDRLWQMDLLRRTASGELAEVLGTGALEEDKRRRALGFARIAEQMVGRLTPVVRAALESYSNGVNAYIESLNDTSLPPEFRALKYKPRPWRTADSLVIGKLFAETLSATWNTDMMRAAFAGVPPERLKEILPSVSPLDIIMVGSDQAAKKKVARNHPAGAIPGSRPSAETLGQVAEITDTMRRSLQRAGVYAEDLAASNNWVVSGKRSVTGKPLLANDPHLQASAPGIWYMLHLTAPGLHVAGVTVPGEPGVIIGHNDSISWGITNVEADVQDLYLERFDKDNARRYMTLTGLREAEVRREEIKVRKNPADPATETVALDITTTRHGPIVFEAEGERYAVAWPALDPTTNEFEAYYFINRARNWQDFRSALGAYTGFPLNFIYADVDGHIGYWAAGRYPIRKTGQGTVPYDGATDAGEWTGYIPFEATPNVLDPPSGIIVTANNRLVGADYPHYITNNWASPFRARRIYNLLTAKEKLNVEDFQAIQADTYSYLDAVFGAEVVKLGQPLAENSPEWKEIVSIFQASDSMMNPDSTVIGISAAMRDAFQRRLIQGAIGEALGARYSWSGGSTFIHSMITTRPPEWLPKEFDSYQALLLACYKDAQEFHTKRVGADKSQWTWGRLSQVRFQHALANAPLIGGQFTVPPFPQNGGLQTVNRGALVSMRLIADLSNWDNTRQSIPLGQSGDPASPHWKDQLDSWRDVTPRVFPYSKNAVAGATKEPLVLSPPDAK